MADSPVAEKDRVLPSSDVVRAVFRKNLPDLAQQIGGHITDFCNRLESASLIDDDLSDEIMTSTGVSRLDKATRLLKAVQTMMKSDVNDPPRVFVKLCEILLRYKSVEGIARNMLDQAGIVFFLFLLVLLYLINFLCTIGMDDKGLHNNIQKVSR